MKDEDFADGIYHILSAIDYVKGGGYDPAAGIDYRNSVFETFHFWSHCECTCKVQDEEEQEHESSCKLEDVGFRHFSSGLEVEWYKWVGRSTKSNDSMKTLDWFKVVVECLESVRDEKDQLDY